MVHREGVRLLLLVAVAILALVLRQALTMLLWQRVSAEAYELSRRVEAVDGLQGLGVPC